MVARPPWLRRLRARKAPLALGAVWIALTGWVASGLRDGLAAPADVAIAQPHVWTIAPAFAGRVTEVRVGPGSLVEPGTVLAIVEEPGLPQTIAAAEAERRALEAQLGTEEAERHRRYARDLDSARTRWLDARVSVERSQAMLEGLEAQVRRATAPGVALAAIETDALQAQRAAAAAEVSARREAVAAFDAAYQQARTRSGMGIAPDLEASLEAATVRLEALRARAAAGQIVAWARGVVSAPMAPVGRDGRADTVVRETFPVAGQWAEPGVPLLTLTAPSTEEAVVYVDPVRARALRAGAGVALHSSDGTTLQGAVRAVGAALEPVPLRQLRDPLVAEWGVPVTLRVDGGLLPGEALAADLPRGDSPERARASR
jgi:hypothetical protein